MIKRIVDISHAAYVNLKRNQLQISVDGQCSGCIPIEDLGVLILQHPAIVITQASISACQKNNVVLVFCDERHLPQSVLFPLVNSNSLHSRIVKDQVKVSEPTKKRLWKYIVKQKISGQAQILRIVGKAYKPLDHLISKVRSGDPDNIEAQAARKYWRLLMGCDFRRDVEQDGVNSLLNYGYSIMRAMLARAIVGSGLHPALGLHHQNQYNSLCLVDDLLEPFRPWVDLHVFQLQKNGIEIINQDSKAILLGMLADEVKWKGKKLPMMVAGHNMVADFKRALFKKQPYFSYPSLVT